MIHSFIFGAGRVRWGNANVVWAGNSLFEGVGATSGNALPDQVAAIPPMNLGSRSVNTGVGGWTWDNLIANGPSVDGLYDPEASSNVFIAWEGTNQIFNAGGSAVDAYGLCRQWTDQRLAVHPKARIVHMTTLPRNGTSGQCGALIAYNNLLVSGWNSTGAAALVDVRKLPEFNFLGTDAGGFSPTYWSDMIHPNDAGYALLASLVSDTLRTLKR